MADVILAGVDDKVLITICFGAIAFVIAIVYTFSELLKSPRSNRTVTPTVSERNHQSYHNDVCPICLGTQRLAVETNCGHRFCGMCLKRYVSRSHANYSLFSNPINCPFCRQVVNILLLSFSTEDLARQNAEDERCNVEDFVNTYNSHFGSGPRTVVSYIRDCPVLIRHMFVNFFTFGGLVWMFRLRVILCCFGFIVYLCNPLDIIPEAVFGIFGFLDDIIIFLLCVVYISIIYRRLIIRRATGSAE